MFLLATKDTEKETNRRKREGEIWHNYDHIHNRIGLGLCCLFCVGCKTHYCGKRGFDSWSIMVSQS